MKIITQRIYAPESKPGYRVLVDRLWPRGISKTEARLDDWWKDLAPSPALRKWFDHDEEKFTLFSQKYNGELHKKSAPARDLLLQVTKKPLILLYGAKSESCNHALVLKEFLESL